MRPATPEAAQGATAFSYHPARACVARRCTTLHALLQHRHHLRLARHFVRRLKAASDFVCRLRAEGRRLPPLPEGRQDPPCSRRLRGLCEELHMHTTHWAGLQQHIRSDPWLHPLLVQRPEVVGHMKHSLLLLALHAVRLLEGCVEASLRSLAQCATGCLPAQLLDFFRAVDFYNRVVGNQALQQALAELRPKPEAKAGAWLPPGSNSHTFPPERVLALLTAERGRLAAQQLYRLLQQRQSGQLAGQSESLPWEGPEESWLLEGHSQTPQGGEGASSLAAELQAFCQQEEDALLCLLREVVASMDSLWHRILKRPQQEKPSGCPEPPDTPGAPSNSACLPGWKSVRWLDASFTEVAAGLYAQYCPLLWRASASTFACKLELHPHLAQSAKVAGAVLGRQLICALAQGYVPQESTETLRALGVHLLLRDVLCHWDRGFCLALGSSLTDKCMARLGPQDAGAPCSQTAQALQRLYQPLAFSLRCLGGLPSRNTGDQILLASLHWKLLSLSVATSHASCYWVMSKAHQYLASWSLSPFLLVTQGDLQVLKTESDKMWALVGEAFPVEGERKQNLLISSQEQELSRQIHSMATSIHLFTEDVLNLFFLDCKRMSSEIFSQTMPLGKHWRLTLRTELPASPSEYALAAAQTVLGQVLEGIQRLPQEAQGLALSQVTTAFVEAWMDHILAQKIKFSLHGALQLKQDFDLVKALLQSEDYGLSLEIRQRVFSLRVFQQVDNAIACLLQQPCKASGPSSSHTWGTFHNCCSYDGIHTLDGGPGSLNSLESLEGLPAQGGVPPESPRGDLLSHMPGGRGCSPETYLSPTQQEWLALRLHGGRRWRVPTWPCMNRTSEP
nr:coiled-coil domain-containing protein 142 [Pogona vitticeps]